jgi:hypothetical protein
MARNITLTLGAGLGTDLGPNFNLTANVGSVTPSTATKSELTSGKSVSVDDAATEVTVTSTGTCTNGITQTIPCGGTTTTTTAATTTTTTTTGPSVVDIYINTISSLDIGITDMRINGVSVTYVGGSNFPLAAGDNGSFTSTETGVQDVEIDYTTSIPGQNITFMDSNLTVTCIGTIGSNGTMGISFAQITSGTTIYVTAADGACI